MDWDKFSAVSASNAYRFRKEIIDEIFWEMWKNYENGEGEINVTYLLELIHTFPEYGKMFDSYFMAQDGYNADVWSNKTLMMRFMRKLHYIYEGLIKEAELDEATQ